MPTTINSSGTTADFSGWNTTTNKVVHNLQNLGYHKGPSGTFNTSKSDDNKCRHRTVDGSRCDLPASFDDDRCHWHTKEQCYYIKDDGEPCELSGAYGDDNRCRHHSTGCNELSHTTIQKATYHGMKFSYRMLGLHSDLKRDDGPFELQPVAAAKVAAEVGRTYLRITDNKYDREESHKYYMDKIVSKVDDDPESFVDRLKNKFSFFGDEDLEDEDAIETLKKGINKAWKQIDKNRKSHADGARTAVAAAEYFLGEEVPIDEQ